MLPYGLESLIKATEETAKQATKTLKAAENFIVSKTSSDYRPGSYRR